MKFEFNVPSWMNIGAKSKGSGKPENTGKNRIGTDTIIIDQLVKEFVDRTRKQIKDWQDAQTMALDPEKPRWYAYQDLIEYLSIDPHYKSQAQILKGTILSNRFFIRGLDGKEIPEKTKLLEKKWFYNLVSQMIESVLKGYTLCQLTNSETFQFTNVPRRNVVPQKDMVLLKVTEDNAVLINDPAFLNTIIYIKNDEEPFGMLNDLVPQLIYKRHAEQAWAMFTERFGLPMVTATTNKSDKKELDKIEAMLKKLGQAAQAVLPEGTTIDVKAPSGQSDPYNVFDKRIARVNSEISKRLLGGTMISDQGSSRSQSEVHERTMDQKIAERFRRMIEFEINEQLIPMLNTWGKGFDLTDEFTFDRTQQISLKDQWQIVKEGMQFYEMDSGKISEQFNLPITGLKQNQETTGNPNFNKPTSAMALALVGKGVSFPLYNATSCCKHHNVYMAGGLKEKVLSALSDVVMQHLWDGKETLALQIEKALITGDLFREALFDSWGERRLQIGYDAVDHKALASMEYNLFHFSCLREKASVFAMNELLLNKETNGIKTFDEFKKAAMPLMDKVNKNWLQTEYNFTVAVGQNASRYQQFIEEMQDVTDVLQYQTVGDDRVRFPHQLLDGRLFSLKDPEARTLWPPNDFGCRCEFLQYLGDSTGKITSGKEGISLINWNDKQKKLFGVNRGDIGQVFLQNQNYIDDNGFADDIKKMKYSNYNLSALKDIKGTKKIKLDKTITEKNVKELFRAEPDADYMGFKDYLSRSLVMKKKVFDTHTTGKYIKEERHQIFPFIADVLSEPDEVYFTEWKQNNFQTNYIKHYNGKSILVNTSLGKNNVEINTWYELKSDEPRKGLLIKGNKKPG